MDLYFSLHILTSHLLHRKIKQQEVTRDVRSGGERDPDKAFQLLSEMQDEGIRPNGVTYCALIDV